MANSANNQFMSDALLTQVVGMGSQVHGEVANVARSGQNGTGVRITKLDGATPLAFNPVIPIVLTVPTMWNKFPQKQEILRALMETHARNISGINFSYTLETDPKPIGHDGQQMDTPLKTTRSQPSPSATFTEYTGNIVYKFFMDWIFDIQHPDTNASALPAMGLTNSDMPGWTMSAYSMSMLFIQPDPTGLPERIIDAFVICNMFPKEIGEIGFDRQLGTVTIPERSINFTGIVQHNNNTKELGIRMMKLLGLHRINYSNALPGVTGSVNPAVAVQAQLHNLEGGTHWEANAGVDRGQYGYNTPKGSSMGSSGSYVPLSEESNAAYQATTSQNVTNVIPDSPANSELSVTAALE